MRFLALLALLLAPRHDAQIAWLRVGELPQLVGSLPEIFDLIQDGVAAEKRPVGVWRHELQIQWSEAPVPLFTIHFECPRGTSLDLMTNKLPKDATCVAFIDSPRRGASVSNVIESSSGVSFELLFPSSAQPAQRPPK